MNLRQRGDDLDDDFVPDELVALSDGEAAAGDDAKGLLSADEAGPQDELQPELTSVPGKENKRKRREKEKERKAKKRKLTEPSDGLDYGSFTARSPAALQEYLSSEQAKTYSTMSALELEDIQIPVGSITDTTSWTGPRTLDQLVDFIITVLPTLHTRLSQKSKSNGAPTVIFVTGAALRVADVTRRLKNQKLQGEKGGEVAKLFAKHFKLAEHIAYLKRTKVGTAVGTPGRIGKLLCETDALSLAALTHIIFEVTFRDAKKRTLLDIPETRDEVFKTVLGCPSIRDAVREGKVQIVLF